MCVSVWVCVLGVPVGNQGFFMILYEMRCLVDIYLERLGGQQGMFLQWLGALSTELFTVMGQDELITEADGELERERIWDWGNGTGAAAWKARKRNCLSSFPGVNTISPIMDAAKKKFYFCL